MDLYAYLQIEDYDPVAKANGIDMPRLRGYRMMELEDPLPQDVVEKRMKEAYVRACEEAMTAYPPFSINPVYYVSDDRSDRMKRKYLIREEEIHVRELPGQSEAETYKVMVTKGIRWDLLHGKKRKAVKYMIKREQRAEREQLRLWNKYAGQKNVLYIHARLGSWNWSGATWEGFRSSPWFLDGCDDAYDPSYCDIYARIEKDNEDEE